MTPLEIIPIGTILSLLIEEIVHTARTANDVLIEKESFRILSSYLSDIEPVLKELQLRDFKESSTTRKALEILSEDVKKARTLAENYDKNHSQFYLLVNCRGIVEELQDITRSIGRSLAALSLATTEILADLSAKVNKIQNEMQRAEFVASESRRRILDKLDQGLQEQKQDQAFIDEILEEIARAVGIPIEASVINKELERFRMEKEEAAVRKERADLLFLEQVIALLSRADAADGQEQMRKQYHRRSEAVEKYGTQQCIVPLKSFMCPLWNTVMLDPVDLSTGTTFERVAIQEWLDSGQTMDPHTGQSLHGDFTLRPNVSLRLSIEEWRELNYCHKIKSAKLKLQRGGDSEAEEALCQLKTLINENPINKDWIAIEGLIDICIEFLEGTDNKELKRSILSTLMSIVQGHTRNKDRVVDRGVELVFRCLGRGMDLSNAAVELLFELLQDGSGWNLSVSKKLAEQSSAILFLVVLLNGEVKETSDKARTILLKLCDDDEENITAVAKANWYQPITDRLSQGSEASRMSIAKILVKMDLVDQNIKLLGEEGVIPPIVQMASSINLEARGISFSALAKLSSCYENKKLIANSGVVPLILSSMFSSSHLPMLITQRCSEILENLCANGIEFLVDEQGASLALEPIVTSLLSKSLSFSNPKHALHALLGICRSETDIVQKVVLRLNGVFTILPLLDNPDPQIQEISLRLLFHFPKQNPEKIVAFLLENKRLEVLVCYLEDDSRPDCQIAAVGLLADLPKSEVNLTTKLVEANALNIIIDILRSGSGALQEHALSVLSRFTHPSDIELQRKVIELGAYPLLVSFLKNGTTVSKARAAALIGDFSRNTPMLSIAPKPPRCSCLRKTRLSVCEVHGGQCNVSNSFCLIEAKALPGLVKLLDEKIHDTATSSLQTLSTLIDEDSYLGGANILHEANAIYPVIDILNWGSSDLKEVALDFLEKVFGPKDIADKYCSTARMNLVGLTTRPRDNEQVARKAFRVLAKLERYSRSLPLV